MEKKCITDPFPIHGRIERLAKNGSLGRAPEYLDQGGEQLEGLSLRDMDKHKINCNYRFFFCGYQLLVFKCCLFGGE